MRILGGRAGSVFGPALALVLVGGLLGSGAPAAARPASPDATHPRAIRVRLLASSSVDLASAAASQVTHAPLTGSGEGVIAPRPPAPPQPVIPGGESEPVLSPRGPSSRAPSPPSAASFAGLDDIANVTSGTVYVPPDTDGAVGLTKVVEALNNNIRVRDKTTGATLSTLSPETFWTGLGGSGFFDPRLTYDPYNDRWIMVALSDVSSAASAIDVAVSKTSDPSGAWWTFAIDADAGNTTWADFPLLGFNKNWVAVDVNMYTMAGAYSSSKVLALDYPALRGGTLTASSFATDGRTAPATTYSSSVATLYMVSQYGHFGGGDGAYKTWTITGTPSSPAVTSSTCCFDRGIAWAEPSGTTDTAPQAAPSSGASACGSTPCPLNLSTSALSGSPVFRGGYIYYTQMVGLPYSGMTHVGVLWTKLSAATGAVSDGGLIEDPTATASNGGKWYGYPSVSVNADGAILVGFSQFSSGQWPSAGYALHASTDAAGTMRDPYIYKAGEDYYHRTLGGTRNRWGDYSSTQVDPSDDSSLWTLQEYAKARTGTDDGTTTSNSSRWGTYWAKVGAAPDTSISSGPTGTVAATSASFDFTSDTGGATFECNIDAGAFTSCASPKAYSGLGSGSHTFSVRAVDGSGIPDPTPASRTWTIDATAPSTTITSSPPAATSSTGASFSFTGSDPGGSGVASFECSLDGGAFAACSSPKAYAGLSEGSHDFSVRAIDAVGNVDASPDSRTWSVDSTAPDTSIDSGTSGTVAATGAAFTFSGSDPGGSGVAGFECSLDAGTFAACSSPKSYSGLALGAHTFDVRAVDAAGNADGLPATTAWTVVASTPDAMVKTPADAAYLGDGTYNLTGLGQTRLVKTARGKTVTFTVGIQNDAAATDTLKLTGTGGSSGFKVKYLAGATLITTSVTGTGYVTPLLAPGASSTVTVKVVVGKTAKGTKTVTLTAASVGSPAAKDVALAKVKVRTT